MSIFSSLNKEQKEAVGLLQIGTFLEYFDLMLYIHMAALLNELFFPKTDPKTASLITAFTFCSTFMLRPLGALLFGYIGDFIGRKTTVILTMMFMATTCIIMANLPTYDQIGITAAWLVTACRVIQGLSSMGEIIGAEIYLTELIPLPLRYPLVGLINCASRFGTMIALGVAMLVMSYALNWRYAFWAAACLAIVGSVSRMRLRETPDFLKRKVPSSCDLSEPSLTSKVQEEPSQKVPFKMMCASFLIYCGPPACLYFSYIFCGDLLKQMGHTGYGVIHQNFFISLVEFLGLLFTVFLSYRIHPLKIIKFKALLFLPFIMILPFLMNTLLTPSGLFIIQILSVCFTLTAVPAVAAIIIHYPVFTRFRYTSILYALSRSLMSIIISFGLVFLTDILGFWAIYVFMIPVAFGFIWGVSYFEKLEHMKLNSL